jgi:D-3-phosphoglycerate dehydrogenase
MPDILVTENIVGPAMDSLRRTHDVGFEPDLWQRPEDLLQSVNTVRALVVRNQTRVTGELVARASRLEIIARAGTGLDNIDVKAATRAGIVVAFTPIQNSVSVAELTMGLMLALARGVPPADRHVKQGGWARQKHTGVELLGKALGVVGFGRIGFLTAMRAKAFGMSVLAYDPYVDPDGLTVTEARPKLLSLDELLGESDFVSCHLPGSHLTRGLFSYDRFCRMKPSAFFLNVARGEVVDEEGLIRALHEGKIAGAALDVRSTEPPSPGPLFEMENVILTPHIAAFTHEAQQRVVASVCRDVAAVLRGEPAQNYANFSRPK